MAESVRLAPATAAITAPPARPTRRTSATVAPQRCRSWARAAIHTAATAALSLVGAVTDRAPPGISGVVAACQPLTFWGSGLTLCAARFGGLALGALWA